jgi:gamma-glutamylcyclotransferase (GGCT)/AIG2-like uncharacterized protein YtfP
MNDVVTTSVLLFSYGTLQHKEVQLAQFGRELVGREDAILGYEQSMLAIQDPEIVALSGKTHHPILRPSTNPKQEILGIVFDITEDELHAADAYEVDEYKRVLVPLKSGLHAWVYVSI